VKIEIECTTTLMPPGADDVAEVYLPIERFIELFEKEVFGNEVTVQFRRDKMEAWRVARPHQADMPSVIVRYTIIAENASEKIFSRGIIEPA